MCARCSCNLGWWCPFSGPEVPPLHFVLTLALRWAAGSCYRRHGQFPDEVTPGEGGREGLRAETAPKGGECGAHPEPPLLLTLRRAWRVFLKHGAKDKGRKKVPQMEANHSKVGEVGVWPRRRRSSRGQRKVSTHVDTQREPWSQKNKGRQACGLFCRRTGGH